jgi:chromosome segregation ATPase
LLRHLLYIACIQVSALSDALDKANESAAEWKEAHTSQKNLLTVQIVQLHNECKAKHQAFVALQLKYDELEASAGHKAAAVQKNATREIEQLRTTLENLSSDKVKLQNALTVSLEDFQRLHHQLALLRKALKESDEKIKTQDSHLELVIREKDNLHDIVRRKEHIEEELGHSLSKQIRAHDEMEEELCCTNAFLSSALENLKLEIDSFSFVFNQSKDELEEKVARLELGVDAQKKKIIHLSQNLHELDMLLQDKESSWQEQTK